MGAAPAHSPAPEPKPKIIIRKKKGGHGGHHGGAWKVAYADFVTAMMALFIVLWLLTQADAKMKKQLAQYFRDPGIFKNGQVMLDSQGVSAGTPALVDTGIPSAPGEANSAEDTAARKKAEDHELHQEALAITNAVAAAAAQDPSLSELTRQVQVKVTPLGLQIEIVDQDKGVLFDIASASLKPGLVKLLKKMAIVLAKLPNSLQVEGHTDARQFPSRSGSSNWDLSFERANNARLVLEASGLRKGQIERVLAYADTDLKVPSNPLADENRRLSILALRASADPKRAKQ